MKTDCSCKVDAVASNYKAKELPGKHKNHQPPTSMQRCIGMLKLIMPPVMLTLIPKCPVCLAGYIAVATGLGVSITTATYLRFLLIILSIGSLLFFLAKQLLAFRKKNNF